MDNVTLLIVVFTRLLRGYIFVHGALLLALVLLPDAWHDLVYVTAGIALIALSALVAKLSLRSRSRRH